MDIRELSISGAFVIEPTIHRDARGAFMEWFRSDRFQETTGHPFTLGQANCSVSAAGTIRGIHYADVPPGQAKYVTCTGGAIVDVVVDLRVGSPTFGGWEAVELDEHARRAVYLSEGLGHGFIALADDTVVHYLCSTPYEPQRERAINPLDPDLGIEWDTTDREGGVVEHVLSERDRFSPTLREAEGVDWLPKYDQVQAYLESLRP